MSRINEQVIMINHKRHTEGSSRQDSNKLQHPAAQMLLLMAFKASKARKKAQLRPSQDFQLSQKTIQR